MAANDSAAARCDPDASPVHLIRRGLLAISITAREAPRAEIASGAHRPHDPEKIRRPRAEAARAARISGRGPPAAHENDHLCGGSLLALGRNNGLFLEEAP
jgi:hypothetical protein